MTKKHSTADRQSDTRTLAATGTVPSLSVRNWSAFGKGAVDASELEAAESFDLPGAGAATEEMSELVLPAQEDEFTCASCFLVRHRSQIARHRDHQLVCTDCAA